MMLSHTRGGGDGRSRARPESAAKIDDVAHRLQFRLARRTRCEVVGDIRGDRLLTQRQQRQPIGVEMHRPPPIWL